MSAMTTIDPSDPKAGLDVFALNFFATGRKILKWHEVWGASGIRHAQRSVEASARTQRPTVVQGIPFPGAAAPVVGEFLVQWRDVTPDEGNQSVHRILAVDPEPGADGDVIARVTPALPRTEWPDALRRATVPTNVYLQIVGESVEIVSATAGKIGTFPLPRHEPLKPYDKAVEAVRMAAAKGHADGAAGKEGTFSVRPGAGDGGLGGDRTWQVVDETGKTLVALPRSLLHRGPPETVQVTLAAAYEAYGEARREAMQDMYKDMIARHFEERDDEVPAPALR